MSYPPGQRAPEHRVDQYCSSCKQYDRHPRHIYVKSFSEIVYKHFDCCRNDGCPDGHCDEVMRQSGGARGDHLVAFLDTKARREQQ